MNLFYFYTKSFDMRAITFYFLCLFCLVNSYSQEYTTIKDVDSFKAKLKSNAQSMSSLQADFVQKKYLSFTEKPIQSSGKFYFKKEQNIRWETVSPTKNTVVITKNYMKIFDGKNVQQFDPKSNKMFSQMNEIMMAAIHGDLPSEKNYKFRFQESKLTYKVTMFPLNKALKEFLKEINIVFDKQKLEVIELELVEPSGDSTRSEFKNRVLNLSLSDKLFDL